MKKLLIVSGGNSAETVILDNVECDFIIAVDSGAKILNKLEISPNLLIGDLDSLGKELISKYRDSNIEVIKADCEKNETDTELAILYAVENGFNEIVIAGATGTRLDHTIGNIMLLNRLNDKGINGKIVDENNEIIITDKDIIIERDYNYRYISILPFGGEVKGLTLDGFKYNTCSVNLEVDSVIGISNEVEKEHGAISIESGSVLIIKSRD